MWSSDSTALPIAAAGPVFGLAALQMAPRPSMACWVAPAAAVARPTRACTFSAETFVPRSSR
eukprot:10564511-Alexandrium_andersonii.AAC.1